MSSSMNKIYTFLKTLLFALILFSFSSSINADPFGTPLGSYNGVICYSNGSNSYVSGMSNSYNGTNTGMKWQCPEYCNRYYVIKYQMDIRNQSSNNADDYYPTATERGLLRFANGSTTAPSTNDLLCLTGGEHGHIALIMTVGSNYVDVIQQNWANNSSDIGKRLSMTVSNGHYTIAGLSSGYSVQGWLRKASISGFGKVSFGVNVSPSPVVMTHQFNVNFTLQEMNGVGIIFDTICIAILDDNNHIIFDLTKIANVNLPAFGTYTYNINSFQFGGGTTPGTYIARAMGYKNSWFIFQTTGSGQNPKSFIVSAVTGIEPTNTLIPSKFSLYQNYPNPFNPNTKINFDIPINGFTQVKIFDVYGKQISTLVNEYLNAGSFEINFNGEGLASGIYFYKIESNKFVDTKRLILIK